MDTRLKIVSDSFGNTISLEINDLKVSVEESDGEWILFSPHFKTIGYSKVSEEDAINDLKSALDTFFQVHSELGTLEEALRNLGWKKSDNTFKKPKLFNSPVFNPSMSRVLAYA